MKGVIEGRGMLCCWRFVGGWKIVEVPMMVSEDVFFLFVVAGRCCFMLKALTPILGNMKHIGAKQDILVA